MDNKNIISISEWYNKKYNKPIKSVSSMVNRPNISVAEFVASKNFGEYNKPSQSNTKVSSRLKKVGIGLGAATAAAAVASAGLAAYKHYNKNRSESLLLDESNSNNETLPASIGRMEPYLVNKDSEKQSINDNEEQIIVPEKVNVLFIGILPIERKYHELVHSAIKYINTGISISATPTFITRNYPDIGELPSIIDGNKYVAIYVIAVPQYSFGTKEGVTSNHTIPVTDYVNYINQYYPNIFANIINAIDIQSEVGIQNAAFMNSISFPMITYKNVRVAQIKYVDSNEEVYIEHNKANIDLMNRQIMEASPRGNQ